MPRTECVGEICDCGRQEDKCACDHTEDGVHMDLDSFMNGNRLCNECCHEFPQDELTHGICNSCNRIIL